ncbi:MAG: DNA polymerase III subunit delta [Chloroflexi bacterium]|nr:DNA polymerase III subunit delta [Chloroflexota bacterium]
MYYIFHGEDEFSRAEQVQKFRAQMGDPQFAELNTAHFDGRKLALGELMHACDAVAFLSDKRLVIVEGMLARFDPRRKKGEDASGESIEEEANPDLAKGLAAYLPRLPETTRLVFVEAKTLAKNNPIIKHAATDTRAHVKEFSAPDLRSLPKWIAEHVKQKGGAIEPDAVNELVAHIGNDLRLLDNEIEKLLTYRANQPIRGQDVRAVVASVTESSVFDLVDAIGRRETDKAMRLLHDQLSHNAAPIYLLAMITRQFRMLIQLRDLAERGKPLDQAAAQLKMHPFVAKKTAEQSRNFSLPQLEAIYQKLLDADIAIKTGRSEPMLALDLLVVELTR